MRTSEKRTVGGFFAALFLCLAGPSGYADIKNTGFEAGPLSLSAEAVVETQARKSTVREIAPESSGGAEKISGEKFQASQVSDAKTESTADFKIV